MMRAIARQAKKILDLIIRTFVFLIRPQKTFFLRVSTVLVTQFLGRCKYEREITYVIIYIHIKLYFVILI